MEGAYVKLLPSDIKIFELGSVHASTTIIPLLRLVWKLKPDIVFATLGFVVSSSLGSIFFPKRTRLVTRLGNTLGAYLDEVKQKSYLKYLVHYKINSLVFYFPNTRLHDHFVLVLLLNTHKTLMENILF